MEKINFRFLNYKHYNKFLQDLAQDKVREDAIVFIQDKLRIWARGKEYACDGQHVANVEGDTLIFKNILDDVTFTLSQSNGTITFTDSRGNSITGTYVLNQTFRDTIDEINRRIGGLNDKIDQNDNNLATVAHTGQYSDLLGKPTPITIDSALSKVSTNPVENKAVYNALEKKADTTLLDDYIPKLTYVAGMKTKQDKLIAQAPIYIEGNIIGANIDADLYVIVTELPDVSEANTNKIYLVEVPDSNGGFRYNQYRVRNGQWVVIGNTQANVDLSAYLKSATAALLYQPIGDYLTSVDLTGYAKLSDIEDLHINEYIKLEYLQQNYQPIGDYALKSWVEETFVKKKNVYTPDQYQGLGEAEGSSSGGIVIPSAPTVIVDSILSETSSNAIENRAVTIALQNRPTKEDLREYVKKTDLDTKANITALNDYVTNIQHQQDLDTKQDSLTAGRGISIINNVISSTLDTNVYVIVQELPDEGNPNKIYLLETEDNGDVIYTEYRWDVDRGWIEQRQVLPEIDLSGYLTRSDAATTYQPVGDYATRTEVNNAHQDIVDNYATNEELEQVDQRFDDYTPRTTLEALRLNINNTFQKKGDYVAAADVATALLVLQQIIDSKYVLKKDVYIPPKGRWSTEEGTPISIAGAYGGTSEGGGTGSMVTLTEQQYQLLVENDMIDESTYYFTYEGEEITNWTFGGTFPIILGGEGLGTLPITLT